MRVAFAGTPEFARVALQALHRAGHEMVLVLTQFGCILAGLGLGLIGPDISWGRPLVWLAALVVCLFATVGGALAYQLRLQQLRSLGAAETD